MLSDHDKVLEFYHAFRQDQFIHPTDAPPSISERVATLKLGLIAEEFIELVAAVLGDDSAQAISDAWLRAQELDQHKRDVVGAADATADLRYVIAGFDIEAGIDSDAVFDEVHNSNLSKLDPQTGEPIISDGTGRHQKGKILKGSDFFDPDIRGILFKEQTDA